MSQPSSKLLIHEPPIQVLPSLACLIGLNEALVIQQVHYWLGVAERKSKIGKTSYGHTWIRNSVSQWQEDNFPWWSRITVQRTINRLESLYLLWSTSTLNRAGYDQTKWYTINYPFLNFVSENNIPLNQIDSMEAIKMIQWIKSNWFNGITQIDSFQSIYLSHPIPETTTETTAKITTEKPSQQQPTTRSVNQNGTVKPAATAAADDIDQDLEDLFIAAGIGRNMQKRLAACSWVDPAYVQFHMDKAQHDGISTALLITRMLEGDPIPEKNSNGCATHGPRFMSGNECLVCSGVIQA